jgi:hypothetical protein
MENIMITREYEITPLENGYLIEHAYKVPSTDKDLQWDYKYKKYMFADWVGVVAWINDNPITIPQEA